MTAGAVLWSVVAILVVALLSQVPSMLSVRRMSIAEVVRERS